MSTTEQRLKELGIKLPSPATAIASYVPALLSGNMLYISGQLPIQEDGGFYIGRVGDELTAEQGQEAARLCGLQILAQARQALNGDLDRIKKCLKLGGFINATTDFTAHSIVLNGASNLLVDVLGERGKHARFAIGVASLPAGAAVEIDALLEVA